jgi:hypothetical protein
MHFVASNGLEIREHAYRGDRLPEGDETQGGQTQASQ